MQKSEMIPCGNLYCTRQVVKPKSSVVCICGWRTAMSEKKSLLDQIQKESEKSWDKHAKPIMDSRTANYQALTIVGSCPVCGAPIYGKHMIFPEDNLTPKFSCSCRMVKTLQQTMETK